MEEFFGLFTTNDVANEQPKYFLYSSLYTGDEILFTACYNIGIPYQDDLCIKYKNTDDQLMELDLNMKLCDQEIKDGSVIYILNRSENVSQIKLNFINIIEQIRPKNDTLLFTENSTLTLGQNSEIFSSEDFNINKPVETTLVNFSISKPTVQEEEDPQDEIKILVCDQFNTANPEPLSIYQSYSFEKTVEEVRKYLHLPTYLDYFLLFEYSNGEIEFFNRGRQLYYYELTEKTLIRIFPQNFVINFEYPNIQKFKLQVNIERNVSDIVAEISKSLSISVHHDYTLAYTSDNGRITYLKRDEPLLTQVRKYDNLFFIRRYFNFSREDLSDLVTALRAMNDVKIRLNDIVVWPSEDQLIDLVYYAWIVYTEGASLKDLFSDVRELFPGKYMTPKNIVQKVQKKYAKATPPDKLNAVRMWLKIIREVPGFGCNIYRGEIPFVKDGKVIWKPAKIIATPLEIIFASTEKTRRDKDAIYFTIPFIHIINAEIDISERITIEYTNSKFATVSSKFTVDNDLTDELFLYISENGKIIRSILSDRAKRRASGEAITFSASIDRVSLKTSDTFGKEGKEFIYDRSMTAQQLIQSAIINLGIKEDPGKYKVMLKISENSYKWLESDTIIGALDLLDHMSIYVLQPVRLTVIKFTNQSKKTLLIDHSQTVSEIIKFIFKKLKIKYIPGYTLYSYDKKPRPPLDTRYFTFGQSMKLDKFLFRRRFFMLNDGLLENRMMRMMTIEDCRHYIMKQQTAITLDIALELSIIYRYVKAEHLSDVINYDGSNLKNDIPPKFKPDEKTKKMLLDKIQNYDHLNHINACRRYMSTVRNVPGFGSETFKVKYVIGESQTLTPNSDAVLTVTPLNFALKDVKKDPKKDFVKVPWKHIMKTQSSPTSFIVHFIRKKDDQKTLCMIIESQEDASTIGNIIIGHMSMLKEINKQRKEMTRELPKEELKRIQGTYKDEDGITMPKQIDMFIGVDPTLITGLDRAWFNITSNRNEVLRMCAESLGIVNYQEFDPIIYALREGFWLKDEMTLNDIKPPRKSYVFMIPKGCKMTCFGPNGNKKIIYYNNTDTVAAIVELVANMFQIQDFSTYTLFSQLQNERPSPLIRGKSIAQQFSPKRGKFYLLRRYFSISVSNFQDPALLAQAYKETRLTVMKENNGAIPVDTILSLTVLNLMIDHKKQIKKEDIPLDLRKILPSGYKNVENVSHRIMGMLDSMPFSSVEKAMEQYVLIAKDIPVLGAEKVSAIYQKKWSLKKDLYDENIYIIIDKKKFYAFNFEDDSPILVMEHRNIYDWVINKDYRIRLGRHWMTTFKYTNSQGEGCDFVFDSSGSFYLIDTIESYREIKKQSLMESRPNRSVELSEVDEFKFQIPIRYADGSTDAYSIELDYRMYPDEVLNKAIPFLHLPAGGQYSLMIEFSSTYRKWANNDEMIGFNTLPVKAKLLIYNTYSKFTFVNVNMETQKIFLNVTDIIDKQIPIIADIFNIEFWLGLDFFVKKSQDVKAEPLDMGRSILEQTTDYKNILLLRRFYSFTKYDLSMDTCAVSVYKEFKKHYLAGIPQLDEEKMITYALYNFAIGCKNKKEYDETTPSSFDEFLPAGYANDPTFLEKLIKKKNETTYISKNVATMKFISEAMKECPRTGCEVYDVLFLNNLNEKHVIEKDPVLLYIGYPKCYIYSKELRETILTFTLNDIYQIFSHTNMVFIDVIQKDKVWANCIFTTKEAYKIYQYIQNIKNFIKPEIKQRTKNQANLNLWGDIKKDNGQFEVKVTNSDDIKKYTVMRFTYEQSYRQILNEIVPMFHLKDPNPDNYALVIKNGKETIIVNEKNSHNVLPAKVGDGVLYLAEKNPRVMIEIAPRVIRTVKPGLSERVENICFKIFKEIEGSYHEGYTLYLKQNKSMVALPENAMIINYPIETNIYSIKRRIFTISIAALNHIPTLQTLYGECKDLFISEKIVPMQSKATKLAVLSFFIEHMEENQQFNTEILKELVPEKLYTNPTFVKGVENAVQKYKQIQLKDALCRYIRICCMLPNFGCEEYQCTLKYNDDQPYEGMLKISPFGITYGGEGFFDAKGTIAYNTVIKRTMEENTIVIMQEENVLRIRSPKLDDIINYFDMVFSLLKRGSFFLDMESFAAALKSSYTENIEAEEKTEQDDEQVNEEEEYSSDYSEDVINDPIINFNQGIINFDHMDLSLNMFNFETVSAQSMMTTFSTVRGTMTNTAPKTSSFELEASVNEMEILPMMSRRGLMLIHAANAISLLSIAMCEFFDNNSYIPIENAALSKKLNIIKSFAYDSINNDMPENVKSNFEQFIEMINSIIGLCDEELNNDDVASKITVAIQILTSTKGLIDINIGEHMNDSAALQGTIDFTARIGLAINLIIGLISFGERLNFSININFVHALEQGVNNFQFSKELYQQHAKMIDGIMNLIVSNMSVDALMKIIPMIDQYESLASNIASSISNSIIAGVISPEISEESSEFISMVHDIPKKLNDIIIEVSKESHNIFEQYLGSKKAAKEFWDSISQVEATILSILSNIPQMSEMKSIALASIAVSKRTFEEEFALNAFNDQFYTNCSASAKNIVGVIKYVITTLNNTSIENYTKLLDEYTHMKTLMFQISTAHIYPTPIQQLIDCITVFADITKGTPFSEMLLKHKSNISDKNFTLNRNTCSGMYVRNVIEDIISFYTEYSCQIVSLIQSYTGSKEYETIVLAAEKITYSLDYVFIEETLPAHLQNYPHVLKFHEIQQLLISIVNIIAKIIFESSSNEDLFNKANTAKVKILTLYGQSIRMRDHLHRNPLIIDTLDTAKEFVNTIPNTVSEFIIIFNEYGVGSDDAKMLLSLQSNILSKIEIFNKEEIPGFLMPPTIEKIDAAIKLFESVRNQFTNDSQSSFVKSSFVLLTNIQEEISSINKYIAVLETMKIKPSISFYDTLKNIIEQYNTIEFRFGSPEYIKLRSDYFKSIAESINKFCESEESTIPYVTSLVENIKGEIQKISKELQVIIYSGSVNSVLQRCFDSVEISLLTLDKINHSEYSAVAAETEKAILSSLYFELNNNLALMQNDSQALYTCIYNLLPNLQHLILAISSLPSFKLFSVERSLIYNLNDKTTLFDGINLIAHQLVEFVTMAKKAYELQDVIAYPKTVNPMVNIISVTSAVAKDFCDDLNNAVNVLVPSLQKLEEIKSKATLVLNMTHVKKLKEMFDSIYFNISTMVHRLETPHVEEATLKEMNNAINSHLPTLSKYAAKSLTSIQESLKNIEQYFEIITEQKDIDVVQDYSNRMYIDAAKIVQMFVNDGSNVEAIDAANAFFDVMTKYSSGDRIQIHYSDMFKAINLPSATAFDFESNEANYIYRVFTETHTSFMQFPYAVRKMLQCATEKFIAKDKVTEYCTKLVIALASNSKIDSLKKLLISISNDLLESISSMHSQFKLYRGMISNEKLIKEIQNIDDELTFSDYDIIKNSKSVSLRINFYQKAKALQKDLTEFIRVIKAEPDMKNIQQEFCQTVGVFAQSLLAMEITIGNIFYASFDEFAVSVDTNCETPETVELMKNIYRTLNYIDRITGIDSQNATKLIQIFNTFMQDTLEKLDKRVALKLSKSIEGVKENIYLIDLIHSVSKVVDSNHYFYALRSNSILLEQLLTLFASLKHTESKEIPLSFVTINEQILNMATLTDSAKNLGINTKGADQFVDYLKAVSASLSAGIIEHLKDLTEGSYKAIAAITSICDSNITVQKKDKILFENGDELNIKAPPTIDQKVFADFKATVTELGEHLTNNLKDTQSKENSQSNVDYNLSHSIDLFAPRVHPTSYSKITIPKIDVVLVKDLETMQTTFALWCAHQESQLLESFKAVLVQSNPKVMQEVSSNPINITQNDILTMSNEINSTLTTLGNITTLSSTESSKALVEHILLAMESRKLYNDGMNRTLYRPQLQKSAEQCFATVISAVHSDVFKESDPVFIVYKATKYVQRLIGLISVAESLNYLLSRLTINNFQLFMFVNTDTGSKMVNSEINSNQLLKIQADIAQMIELVQSPEILELQIEKLTLQDTVQLVRVISHLITIISGYRKVYDTPNITEVEPKEILNAFFFKQYSIVRNDPMSLSGLTIGTQISLISSIQMNEYFIRVLMMARLIGMLIEIFNIQGVRQGFGMAIDSNALNKTLPQIQSEIISGTKYVEASVEDAILRARTIMLVIAAFTSPVSQQELLNKRLGLMMQPNVRLDSSVTSDLIKSISGNMEAICTHCLISPSKLADSYVGVLARLTEIKRMLMGKLLALSITLNFNTTPVAPSDPVEVRKIMIQIENKMKLGYKGYLEAISSCKDSDKANLVGMQISEQCISDSIIARANETRILEKATLLTLTNSQNKKYNHDELRTQTIIETLKISLTIRLRMQQKMRLMAYKGLLVKDKEYSLEELATAQKEVVSQILSGSSSVNPSTFIVEQIILEDLLRLTDETEITQVMTEEQFLGYILQLQASNFAKANEAKLINEFDANYIIDLETENHQLTSMKGEVMYIGAEIIKAYPNIDTSADPNYELRIKAMKLIEKILSGPLHPDAIKSQIKKLKQDEIVQCIQLITNVTSIKPSSSVSILSTRLDSSIIGLTSLILPRSEQEQPTNSAKGMIETITAIASCTLEECKAIIARESKEAIETLHEIISHGNDKKLVAKLFKHTMPMISSLVRVQKENPNDTKIIELKNIVDAIASASNESETDSPGFRLNISSLVSDISNINSSFEKAESELDISSILIRINDALGSGSSQVILQSIAEIDSEISKASNSGFKVPEELNSLMEQIGYIKPVVVRSFSSKSQLSEADMIAIETIKSSIVEMAKKETPPVFFSELNGTNYIEKIEAEKTKLASMVSNLSSSDDSIEESKELRKVTSQIIEAVASIQAITAHSFIDSSCENLNKFISSFDYMLETTHLLSRLIQQQKYASIIGNGSKQSCNALLTRMSSMRQVIEDNMKMEAHKIVCSTAFQSMQLTTLRVISALFGSLSMIIASSANAPIREVFLSDINKILVKYDSAVAGLIESIPPLMEMNMAEVEGRAVEALVSKYKTASQSFRESLNRSSGLPHVINNSIILVDLLAETASAVLKLKDFSLLKPDHDSVAELPPDVAIPSFIPNEPDLKTAVESLSTSFTSLMRAQELFAASIGTENSEILSAVMVFHAAINCFVSQAMAVSTLAKSTEHQQEITSHVGDVVSKMNILLADIKARFMLSGTWEHTPERLRLMRQTYENIMQVAAAALVAQKAEGAN